MQSKTLLISGLLYLLATGAKAQYTDLHDFSGPDGDTPYNSLTLSGNILYGVTSTGGTNWLSNDGNIFSIKTDGTSFKDLFDFNSTNGRNPYSTLVFSGGILYGTSWMGETNDFGNIFNIDTNGNAYTDMYDFNNTNGGHPHGSLILSNNVFYGTTESGGAYDYGCVFSINKNGTGYKDLFDFNDTNGSSPKGSLIILGNVLYGMTEVGGKYSYGRIFSIHTNGTGFKDLLDFNGTNGGNPQGSLIFAGGKLYGMATWGGVGNDGIIFSIDTSGAGYKDLHDFALSDGQGPAGDLTISGNTLYGMTETGGLYGMGVIFSVDTNGSAFTDQLSFDYTNGAVPYGSLILSGNTLYGMTSEGGANGGGVVFSFVIPPPTYNISNLTISIDSFTNITCGGNNTGSITAFSATGGVSPYTYSWSPNGGNNLTASNLSAGSYTITVTDSAGSTATASTTITQPAPVTISIASVNLEACEGVGNITALPASGGTAPYTYQWLPYGGTGLTATDLNDGTYTIVVTDYNGCSATASAIINLPAHLAVMTNLISGITCNGAFSAAISATPTGGNSPYTYSWSPGGETTASISNLSSGTYSLTVTDSNGCNAVGSITVSQPNPITFDNSATNASECNGTAIVNATGGVMPYTYYWPADGETTNYIKNKCPGEYCCVVTDFNGCSQTTCVTINSATGTEDITSNSASINVYPNPTASQFTISGTEQGMIIGLYDALGREINNVTAGNETMKFNLSNQPDGIYLIRILSANGALVSQKKVIKKG